MEVSAFTAAARAEFMRGKMAADDRPFPAAHDLFTTVLPSTVKVETHTFMSSLPRLAEFRGYTPFAKLVSKEYTVANKEYRTGISVRKTDIDDDQIGGYMLQVNGLPNRAKKDVGHLTLAHMAAGTTGLCFDGTAFFADSHVIGAGDNLDTFNADASDGATHKIVAMVVDNPSIRPVIFQDREPLSSLQTDADTPQALKQKEMEYWVDGRFGLGYGYWWDALHMTITDTPTVPECYEIVEQIINQFRTFTLPKAKDTDDALYVHEGWEPNPQNFVLACNMKLGVILRRALKITQYQASTGNVDNVYQDVATVLPTSALGA
jgi:phage major head subunit gpT-like protein